MLVKSRLSSESTHRGRRVGLAEERQPAALVARALREHEVAGRRGHERVDEQPGHGTEAADAAERRHVRHRAHEVDEVVVGDDLERRHDGVAGGIVNRVEVGRRAEDVQAYGGNASTAMSVVLAWPTT